MGPALYGDPPASVLPVSGGLQLRYLAGGPTRKCQMCSGWVRLTTGALRVMPDRDPPYSAGGFSASAKRDPPRRAHPQPMTQEGVSGRKKRPGFVKYEILPTRKTQTGSGWVPLAST